VFTQKELEYCLKKEDPIEHLAVKFSGKEAVIKAIYSYNNVKLNYNDIEILNLKGGEPTVNILSSNYKNLDIRISLSHSEDNSLAFTIIQGVQ